MIEPISFEVPGVSLSGVMYKSENPKGKILFSPGLCTDDTVYGKFLDELSGQGFTVFTFSYRGTGNSAGTYDIRQNLLDVECIAKQLAGDGKIALVGHSMGAGLSLKVAKKHPEIVSSAYVLAPYLGLSFRPKIEQLGYKIMNPIWRLPVIKQICSGIAHLVANIKGHKFGNRTFEIIMDAAELDVELPDVPHALVMPSKDITIGKQHYNLKSQDLSHVAKGMEHSFNKRSRKPFADDCLRPLVSSIAGFVSKHSQTA